MAYVNEISCHHRLKKKKNEHALMGDEAAAMLVSHGPFPQGGALMGLISEETLT